MNQRSELSSQLVKSVRDNPQEAYLEPTVAGKICKFSTFCR